MFRKILQILLVLFVVVVPINIVNAVNAAEVCPNDGDWIKYDDLSGTEYTIEAPVGFLIIETCYKAGQTCVYESFDPPVSSVTIISEVYNNPGGVICTAPGEPIPACERQEISHASMLLVELTEPTETPTPTNTPTDPPTDQTPTPTPFIQTDVNTGGGSNILLIGIGITIILGAFSLGFFSRKKDFLKDL